MKTFNKTIGIISLAMLFFACKNNISPPDNNNFNHAKFLSLDKIKRAYYNAENNRYETNVFSSDSSSFSYSVKVEKDKKYRILLYGFYMDGIKMRLLDNSNSLIDSGIQANVGNTAEYIIYDSKINDTLYIKLSDEGVYNNQPFFLSFEEVNSYQINWKGHVWECDGDWDVNPQNQLIFKAYNSGFSKWVKLKDTSLTNYNCNISFIAEAGQLENFLGTAVKSSENIYNMMNLPDVSKQFKINGTKNWELWHINLGTGGGVGRETGVLENSLNLSDNIMTIVSENDSVSFFVNNELAVKTNINASADNLFYLTTEDFGSDSLIITDLKFY